MSAADIAFAEVGRALSTLTEQVSLIAANVTSQQQAYTQLAEATAALSRLSNQQTEMQQFALQQQATIAQATAAATSNTHSQLNNVSKVFSNVKLPLFEGTKDKSQLDTWLFHMEQCFLTINGINDDQKVLLASMQLRANAAQWFRAISKSYNASNPLTWDKFKELITATYLPVARRTLARNKLDNARQLHSLDQYVTYLRGLFADIDGITEDEMMARFKHGLQPSLQREVVLARPAPKTFEEMVHVAALHESLKRSTTYTGASSHNNETGPAPMELDAIGRRDSNNNRGRGRRGRGRGRGRGQTRYTPRICYICESPDHLSYECPEKLKDPKGQEKAANKAAT